MKELKLFLRKLALFGFCFALVYFLVIFILANFNVFGNKLIFRTVQGMVWKGGYTYDRFREFDENKKYDILVFGSSRVNRGLNPVPFENAGYTFYNLGTDDQTPINTYVLVNEYVRNDNCRMVIIDLYDKVFAQNPLESTADLIQNLQDNETALKMTLLSHDIRAVNLFSARLMRSGSGPDYHAETSLYRGFRKVNNKFRYSSSQHLYVRNENQLKAMEKTFSYLKSINVPVILISQPMPYFPKGHHQFIRDIEPMLKKYDLNLYDFTAHDRIVSADGFADMSHLNASGADQYSEFLLHNVVKDELPLKEESEIVLQLMPGENPD